MSDSALILEALKIAIEQQSNAADKFSGVYITNITACGALVFFSQNTTNSSWSSLMLILTCLFGVATLSGFGAGHYMTLENLWSAKQTSYISSITNDETLKVALARAERSANQAYKSQHGVVLAFWLSFIPAALLALFLMAQKILSRDGLSSDHLREL